MAESRLEPLFVQLERIITDYRGLRRQVTEGDRQEENAQVLARRVKQLERENAMLQHRQNQICERIAALLAQVEHWGGED